MASGLCWAALEAEQRLEGEHAGSVRGHTTPVTEAAFPAGFSSYRTTVIG